MLESDCLQAANLAKSPIHYLLLFKALTAVIATCCPILLLKYKGLSWLGHKHTKIYFGIHLFWAVELPLTYSFVYTYDFIRLFIARDDCDYMLSAKFSLNTRILPVIGLIGQIFSTFVICIERAVSTIKPFEYERVKRLHIAIIVSFIQVIAAISFTYGMLFPNMDWDQFLTTYTLKTRENANRFQIMSMIEVVLEVTSVVVFYISLVRNNIQHKRFSEDPTVSLGNKYQITENRKVIKNLLPPCMLHSLFVFINSFGLSIYPVFFPEFSPQTHAFYLECIGQVHLYSICMPVVIAYGVLRKHRVVINKVQHQDEYFAKLQEHFEKSYT